MAYPHRGAKANWGVQQGLWTQAEADQIIARQDAEFAARNQGGGLLGDIVGAIGGASAAVGTFTGLTSLSNVEELDSPALDLAFPTVFSQDVHEQAARAGAATLLSGAGAAPVAEPAMFDFSNPLEAGDWWVGNEELYFPTVDDFGVDWTAVAAGWEGLAADSAAQNAALASGSSFGWLDTIWSGARPLVTEYLRQEIIDDYRPDMPTRAAVPARPSMFPLAPLGAVRGDPLAQPAVKSLLTVGALALVGIVAYKALKKGPA